METIINYELVVASDASTLSDQIREALRLGWELYCEPIINSSVASARGKIGR